jgi:hypothetical protein
MGWLVFFLKMLYLKVFILSYDFILEFIDVPEVISNLQANTVYWQECSEALQLQQLQQEQETTNFKNRILEDNENETETETEASS